MGGILFFLCKKNGSRKPEFPYDYYYYIHPEKPQYSNLDKEPIRNLH